jgi:hypothetical protein
VDASKRETHHMGSGLRKFMRKLRPFADVESCAAAAPTGPARAQRAPSAVVPTPARAGRRLKEQVISRERLAGAKMLVMGNPRDALTETEVRGRHAGAAAEKRAHSGKRPRRRAPGGVEA